MATKKTQENRNEKFVVRGDKLITQVKSLIKEGNVRSITIKNKKGEVLMKFPLTVGVIGVALVPVLAAVGAIAALVSECSLEVERK
jgi:hypothetical protein